jgi:hypothetical protein
MVGINMARAVADVAGVQALMSVVYVEPPRVTQALQLLFARGRTGRA